MKLFIDNERFATATKTKQPSFSWKHGRGWDGQSKTIDGVEVRFHYEVARGTRMYFRWAGQWYVARMFQDNDPFDFQTFTTALLNKC